MSKYHKVYMDIAEKMSELSYANRKKVGCIIVRDNRILAESYNGTAPGADNNCEDEHGVTKPDVLHAELNALAKLGKSTESSKNTDLYVTLSPCMNCAVMIHAFGVKRVFYREEYRITDGIDYLIKHNIEVNKID